MSDFTTSSLLEVTVSQSSLRDARAEIEDEVGDVTVDVDASTSGGSASSQLSNRRSREAAMSRQLLSGQSETLTSISDQLDGGLDLDETRNDLLREILDETESIRSSSNSGGNMLRSVGSLGAGLAAAGVGITGVLVSQLSEINLAELISEAIPTENLVSGTVEAASLISGSVSASTLITGALGPAALIAGTVQIGDFVAGEIVAGDLVTGDVAAATLVTGTVGASTLITGAVGASAIVTGAIAIGEFVSGSIDISDYIEGDSSGEDGGPSDDSGSGSADGVGTLLAAGGGALTAGSLMKYLGSTGGGGGGAAASRAAGASMPLMTPEMFPDQAYQLSSADSGSDNPTIFDKEHIVRQKASELLGGGEGKTETREIDPSTLESNRERRTRTAQSRRPGFAQNGSENQAAERRRSRGRTNITVEQNIEIRDLRSLRRELNRRIDTLERDLKSQIDGGR